MLLKNRQFHQKLLLILVYRPMVPREAMSLVKQTVPRETSFKSKLISHSKGKQSQLKPTVQSNATFKFKQISHAKAIQLKPKPLKKRFECQISPVRWLKFQQRNESCLQCQYPLLCTGILLQSMCHCRNNKPMNQLTLNQVLRQNQSQMNLGIL